MLSTLAWCFTACGGGDDEADGSGSSGTSSDGAPSSGDATPGGDAKVPLTPKQACEDYLDAACTRLRECGRPINCDALKKFCPDNYLGEGMRRNQEQLEQCAAARRAQSCTDIAAGIDPPCVVNGTIPGGEPCHFNAQCQSGRCDSQGQGDCGVCYPLVPVGGQCDEQHFCDVNVDCQGGTCVAIPLPTPQPAGSACNETAGCSFEAPCTAPAAGADAGSCTPAPGEGAPCGYAPGATWATLCAAPARCFHSDPTLPDGICSSQPSPANGPCGSAVGADCIEGTFCTGGDTGTCQPRHTVNQACADSSQCAAELYCSVVSQTCQPRAALGAPCLEAEQCAVALACEQAPGADAATPGVCSSVGGIGDPCGAPNQACAGALQCTNGVCTLVACVGPAADASVPPDAGAH